MAQPFTGQKKTPNKNFDTSKDNVCPALRSMSMKDLKSPTALTGQIGHETKLVHGDRWQHLDGNFTERIDKSLDTYIKIDEKWEVHGNLTYTVGGNTNDNRYGQHFQTNWQTRTDHFVHTRTENHDQPEHINQPTENVNWFQTVTEFNWQKHSTQILYFTASATKFELDGLEMSWKRYVGQYITLRNVAKPGDLTWTGVKNDLGGIANRIKAMRNTAAVAHTEVEPTASAAPVAEEGIHVPI